MRKPWKPVSKWAYWSVVRAHKAGGNTTRRQALKYNTYAQNVTDLNIWAAFHRRNRLKDCRCFDCQVSKGDV